MRRFRHGPAVRGEGRFVKQSGPIGHFAHVVVELEFPEAAETFSIVWKVPEAAIPIVFRDAVARGILHLFEPGARYADYSSDGVVVRVVGGTTHPTDSDSLSFELAAANAFENAAEGS